MGEKLSGHLDKQKVHARRAQAELQESGWGPTALSGLP